MKKSLTKIIAGKLLDAASDPTKLEAVMTEYSQSKGPYYTALAQATTLLSQKLSSIGQQCHETQAEYQELNQKTASAANKLSGLNQSIETGEKQLATSKKEAQAQQSLLDEAAKLAQMGFGTVELSKLHEVLAQISNSHGKKPEKVVAAFFNDVQDYQNLASLKMQVESINVARDKAKADMEHWQAEANAAESHCKLKKSTIVAAETLLVEGIEEYSLPHWQKILSKSGVTPEGLAEDLEQYASIEKLRQSKEEQSKELSHLIAELKAQVDMLAKERDGVISSIDAIREKAVAQVTAMSAKVMEVFDGYLTKVAELGQLERQTASLKPELALARAIKNPDWESWKPVSRETIRELISGLLKWCSISPENNPGLPPSPQYIQNKGVHVNMSIVGKKVTFEDALVWARAALYSEKERQALKL